MISDSHEGLKAALNQVLAGATWQCCCVPYMALPPEHWTRIYSTNPLERLNKEVKRRTNVVGVFPDEAAVVRLIGAVLLEQADEWEVDRRYFSQESMRRLADLRTNETLLKRFLWYIN